MINKVLPRERVQQLSDKLSIKAKSLCKTHTGYHGSCNIHLGLNTCFDEYTATLIRSSRVSEGNGHYLQNPRKARAALKKALIKV